MKNQVTIDTVNYFGDRGNTSDFNAKVFYRKNGKLYLAHVHIDFFNERVYIPRQPKECKILAGFETAININQFPKRK